MLDEAKHGEGLRRYTVVEERLADFGVPPLEEMRHDTSRCK
jgi:hypothetical protein